MGETTRQTYEKDDYAYPAHGHKRHVDAGPCELVEQGQGSGAV